MDTLNTYTVMYYSFENSTIIKGYINDTKQIIFTEIIKLQNLPVENLKHLLIDGTVVTNENPIIKRIISNCVQYSLLDDMSPYEELIKQLKYENRIINETSNRLSTTSDENVLKLFMMCCYSELMRDNDGCGLGFTSTPTPTSIYRRSKSHY